MKFDDNSVVWMFVNSNTIVSMVTKWNLYEEFNLFWSSNIYDLYAMNWPF